MWGALAPNGGAVGTDISFVQRANVAYTARKRSFRAYFLTYFFCYVLSVFTRTNRRFVSSTYSTFVLLPTAYVGTAHRTSRITSLFLSLFCRLFSLSFSLPVSRPIVRATQGRQGRHYARNPRKEPEKIPPMGLRWQKKYPLCRRFYNIFMCNAHNYCIFYAFLAANATYFIRIFHLVWCILYHFITQ